jgi:hypothetical protein
MHTTHPPLIRMTYIDEQIKLNRYPNCFQIAKKYKVNWKITFIFTKNNSYGLE